MTWQPIDTAPRDGSWILLRGESGYVNRPYRVHVGHWDAEYRPRNPWLTSEQSCFEDDGGPPTHWMPLPTGVAKPDPEHRCGVRGFAESGDKCRGCIVEGRVQP